MTRRYYVPDLPIAGGLVELPEEEARHAARVMRIQVGDPVELFNGQGAQSEAEVRSVDKRSCTVVAQPAANIDRELIGELHLAIALPKPDRAKEMVERLTELGVTRMTPLVCQRSQRPPSSGLLEKLKRCVIEACKQSGRNVLMEIEPVQTFEAFLSRDHAAEKWIAHPDGGSVGMGISEKTPSTVALIGPEGGFSHEEYDAARDNGFLSVGLGERIYRIETAACVIAVIFGN